MEPVRHKIKGAYMAPLIFNALATIIAIDNKCKLYTGLDTMSQNFLLTFL